MFVAKYGFDQWREGQREQPREIGTADDLNETDMNSVEDSMELVE